MSVLACKCVEVTRDGVTWVVVSAGCSVHNESVSAAARPAARAAKMERTAAHRIEVDSCRGCPFIRVRACFHPAIASDDYGRCVGGIVNTPPKEPPDWCPLRGAVTLIAGPK